MLGPAGGDRAGDRCLEAVGRSSTTGALGARLGLTAGSATRVVDRLVAAGLARRVTDPADRRRVLVEHTGALPEGLGELLGRVQAPLGRLMGELSEPERAGVTRYLEVAEQAYRQAVDGMIEPSTTLGGT